MTHRLSIHRSAEVEEHLLGSDRDLEAAGFQILDTEQELERERDLHEAVAGLTVAEQPYGPPTQGEAI